MNIDNIIFMKFGYHALENKNEIIERKQREYHESGKIFWGYGGTICHPIKQVQPFVKEMSDKGLKVFLAMTFTKSKPSMKNESSKSFSHNSVNWQDIPLGINVTGSKYAIVCSKLIECDYGIDLSQFSVALGPSKGKNANDYIKNRIDKGCLIKNRIDNKLPQNNVKIQLLAQVIAPYSVLLK